MPRAGNQLDHQIYAPIVNATRHDIGRDQQPNLTTSKSGDDVIPFSLGSIRMKDFNPKALESNLIE